MLDYRSAAWRHRTGGAYIYLVSVGADELLQRTLGL